VSLSWAALFPLSNCFLASFLHLFLFLLQIEKLEEARAAGSDLNDEQLAKVSAADDFRDEVRLPLKF